MGSFTYHKHPTLVMTGLFHITGVSYPDLEQKPYSKLHVVDPSAKVTLYDTQQGNSFELPISMSSMSLLPSPQQRALEEGIRILRQDNKILAEANQKTQATVEHMAQSLADKDREIERLKLSVQVAEQTGWKGQADKHWQEVKRLEKVCYSHAEGKQDAERKWTETVGELDNTKNQLKEVRVANGKLLEAKNQAEAQVTRFATRNSDLEQECASLSKNKNSLLLTVQELRGKVQELNFAGAAKERDEYSKSLNVLKIKFEQATKEAKAWKDRALVAEKKVVELLGDVVGQRTVEWTDAPLPVHQKPIAFDAAVTQAARERLGALAQERLAARVSAVETRVTKLEEAEGFPMESYNIPDLEAAMLFMGGQWREGFRGLNDGKYRFLTACPGILNNGMTTKWDKANQPTRWKPMPKEPDPMAGYRTLLPGEPVRKGDEYLAPSGNWEVSGNWAAMNGKQGPYSYRRKTM